jgi:class 3 adenylate cyclase/pimeloyl-ACP methyl ester carboxylesterase
VDQPRPDIRFTTTDDGVSLAFWEIGGGEPVVLIQNWGISHAELEWSVSSIRRFYGAMAERYRLVRFDPRGVGMSGDPPGGWGSLNDSDLVACTSSERQCLDIETVSHAAGLEPFTLMAVSVQVPIAIEFAARHPDIVTALILYDGTPSIAEGFMRPLLLAQRSAMQIQGEATGFSRLTMDPWMSWTPEEDKAAMARLLAAGDTRAVLNLAGEVHPQFSWNANPYLPDIAIPTLILCSDNSPFGDGVLSDSRNLASRLEGSTLRLINGTSTPYFADQSQVLEAIDKFLKPKMKPERASGFRTVVFTDIVDSTKFMYEAGDEEGRNVMRVVEERVADLAVQHGGRVIKNLGDGSLVSFTSNTAALRFALDVQAGTDPDSLRLRVGMAAGEPIEEGGDIHGAVVAYASRVADLGEAGEIVASDTVRQLAMGKGFEFTSMGQFELKGFDEPATVWKVSSDAW